MDLASEGVGRGGSDESGAELRREGRQPSLNLCGNGGKGLSSARCIRATQSRNETCEDHLARARRLCRERCVVVVCGRRLDCVIQLNRLGRDELSEAGEGIGQLILLAWQETPLEIVLSKRFPQTNVSARLFRRLCPVGL